MRVLSSGSHRAPTIVQDREHMRTLPKILAGLALVVPMGAYVAGAMASSADSDPTPRQTIEIRPADSGPTHTPSQKATGGPSSGPSDDDHSGRGHDGDDDDDDGVITPEYDDRDDHDDEFDDDGRHGDDDDHDDHGDDSGHGSGDDGGHDGDDDSGHGGGDD